MSDTEILEFLAESRVLQVATIGRGGEPHLAPMWFVVDDGKIMFRSFTKSQKIVNLQRDPRLTVLVETGDAYEELRGVMIRGNVRLLTEPDAVLAMYGRLAAKYAMVGPEPVELDPDALEAAFGRFAPKNTGVVVEPIKVTSWDHRKLSGAY